MSTSASILNFDGDSDGSVSYTSVTYSELRSLMAGSTLVPGSYYLITDFLTVYDQPDFDDVAQPKSTVATLTGADEPLLCLAISEDQIADEVFSPSFPDDKLRYDPFWDVTEHMDQPAKGRITERIDNYGNRTDYDHRNILFKRYQRYVLNLAATYVGTLSITGLNIVGAGTSFTSLTSGTVFFTDQSSTYSFVIDTITDNTHMTVVSNNLGDYSGGVVFYEADPFGDYDCYMDVSGDYQEFKTFQSDTDLHSQMNYIADFAPYYEDIISGGFILSNNVLKENAFSNTFNGITVNNTLGTTATFNKIKGAFVGNIFGNGMSDNNLDGAFASNLVGQSFVFNTATAKNFSNNIIGQNCAHNQFYEFRQNILADGFKLNIVQAEVISVDFTSATRVYGSFNCTIFYRADLAIRLGYFNASDVYVIVPITT